MNIRKHIRFRHILWLSAIFFAFLLGFMSAYKKYFPYRHLRDLIQGGYAGRLAYRGDPLLAYRDRDTSGRVRFVPDSSATTGVYLVYGQSNASNSGQIGYAVRHDVFQFFEGACYRYMDPALGGNGGNGSIWGMVGDRLIDSGLHRQVVFAVAAVGGRTLRELTEGEYYEYFKRCHQGLLRRFGKVDGILFHQGEYNHSKRFGHDDYFKRFEAWMFRLKNDGIIAPVYLCRTSYCDQGVNYGIDPVLLSIQDSLVRSVHGIRRGPNSDELTARAYRLPDRCHFSMEGYSKLAELWIPFLRSPSEF
jgi:hypothetical protein